MAYAGTSADRAQETLDVMLAELVRLGEGIDESELRRLKARVRSALICEWPGIRASAADGIVFIDIEAQLAQENKVRDNITAAASTVTGVEEIRVNVRPTIFP